MAYLNVIFVATNFPTKVFSRRMLEFTQVSFKKFLEM